MSTQWVYVGPFRIDLKAGARVMSAPAGTITYTRVQCGIEVERIVHVRGRVRLNAAGPEYLSGMKTGYPFYWAPRFVRCVRTENGLVLWHEHIRSSGRICRRCGGSGSLLRPTEKKLLNFKCCSNCGGKGIPGMRKHDELPGTLELLRERMIREGRAFGAKARREANRPQMPEPVHEGSNGYTDVEIRHALEYARLHMLGRLRISKPLTWQQFLDRKQDEIDVWRR